MEGYLFATEVCMFTVISDVYGVVCLSLFTAYGVFVVVNFFGVVCLLLLIIKRGVCCCCLHCGVFVIVCLQCGVFVIVCLQCGVFVIVCLQCGVFRRWYKSHQRDMMGDEHTDYEYQRRTVPPISTNGMATADGQGHADSERKSSSSDKEKEKDAEAEAEMQEMFPEV